MAAGDHNPIVEIAIVTIIVVAVAIPILVSLGPSESGDAEIKPETNTAVTVDSLVNSIPGSVDVTATREYSVAFDGQGGHVAADTTDSLATGSWTVCAAGELDTDANLDATAPLYAYDNASILIQYDAGNWVAYFDNGSHDAMARIDAPSPASGLTPVCGRYNETANELVVSRGASISSPVALTSATTPRNVSVAWSGRIDEVREFGRAVNDATLQAYGDDPMTPLPNRDRISRWMLDEGEGTSTTVYWNSADGTVVNGTWTDGVADPGPERGVDYELHDQPFRFEATDGGHFDGAPVAYVSWSNYPLGINLDVTSLLAMLIGLLLIVEIYNRMTI